MRKIISLQPADNFLLHVEFEDSVKKTVDMKPFLALPVFAPLSQPGVFMKVTNKGYFIEWTGLEIDLSADTLWHEGR